MKIIKAPEKSWAEAFACKGCSAELEADENDILIKHYAGDQREPGYDTYYLKCPCCDTNYTLDDSKLPKMVILNIRKKKHNLKEIKQSLF